MKNLTFQDIHCAYKKLKALAYHDTSDLFLRWKIAKFESNSSFDSFRNPKSVLGEIFDNLTDDKTNSSVRYWDEILGRIDFYPLPKQIMTYDEHEKRKYGSSEDEFLIKNIFTNKRELSNESYEVTKLTLFVDAPIEVYIISILWIMKVGYSLDKLMDSKCFGNRLAFTKGKSLPEDERLFKPYFKQYQKWRDEGISMAKHYLDNGDDVLFLNLDIKDYYYSVRIRQEDVDDCFEDADLAEWKYLNDLFWDIHGRYTSRVKNTKYPNSLIENLKNDENILPIGLPSSYILANWYLNEFDRRVNEFINPVYYSRYVDDIFIVTSKNDFSFDFSEKYTNRYRRMIDKVSKLRPSEKYVIGLLYPVLKLVRSPYETSEETIDFSDGKEGSSKFVFSISGYKNLYIQASKTLVYFFDSESSKALLDKFKNELEKKSSEFRFLPDDELEKSGFDEEAYELVFEDSQHKIKTLKDYRENRYGISAHLSKKIFYTLRNGSRGTDEDIEKVILFFKGTINLEHYRQWERLLTYLVINEKDLYLFEYIESTLNQIKNIRLADDLTKSKIHTDEVMHALTQQFILSVQLAIALRPKIDLPKKLTRSLESCQNAKVSAFWIGLKPRVDVKTHRGFRISNMIRHNYVSIPLLNYIKGSDDLSLVSDKLIDLNSIYDGEFDEDRIVYSPRRIKFYEAAWMQCILRVSGNSKVDEADLLFGTSINKSYLGKAFDIYFRINFWHIADEKNQRRQIRNQIFNYKKVKYYQQNGTPELRIHEVSVNVAGHGTKRSAKLSSVRIGLANMKVSKDNYAAAMLGKPILDGRYKELAKILNMAETEKCDLVVLPELAVPPSLIPTFLDYSAKRERGIITGLEHWTQNNTAYNFVLTLLPCTINGIKDTVPVLRLKNHYSPAERFWIREYETIVPEVRPNRYHLFHWRGVYFSVYYCFELSDIFHRSVFKSKVDLIIASEWNPDVNYFSNIAESAARDLHCYFVQVNTNPYGDSRIVQPSMSELKDMLKIKGGENVTLLVGEIHIDRLRSFQYKGYGEQKDDKEFKPTPADYNRENVKRRQDGKSFKTSKR